MGTNMKKVSTINSSKTDSPKTPGGISRSLLTPCRRLGLSRNFRKSGASPFQSPLSSNTEAKQEQVETRKRKEPVEEIPKTSEDIEGHNALSVTQTPTRNVALPRRKKSKPLLVSMNQSSDQNELQHQKVNVLSNTSEGENLKDVHCKNSDKDKLQNLHNTEVVSTPTRLNSERRTKKKNSPKSSNSNDAIVIDLKKENLTNIHTSTEHKEVKVSYEQEETIGKSPNDLTKECIVVLQKKIFKKELKEKQKTPKTNEKPSKIANSTDTVSQSVFDSDSDDVPLICLNNKEIGTKPTFLKDIDGDEDFAASNTKLKNTDNTKLKIKSPARRKNKNSTQVLNVDIHKQFDSQNSAADDDDFFEKKKTILIRKNYDKVMKPQKAKSTGSITQKDIDDLKARIEVKKKMLLGRAMTEDTKELRDLIKKWQKGCQDAVMELMDLMKNKVPDKQNMDYSEILQTLKIPASLVGYDSDNDCFVTPDDESIILANVKV